MTTARDIMTQGAKCIGESDSVLEAAKLMARLNVGSLPICGDDNLLKGMVTDRDIVVKVLGEGKDPAQMRAGELAQGTPTTIDASDNVEMAVRAMKRHEIRRLPVLDGHDLVGIISQGDIAMAVDHDMAGELVEAISEAP